MFDPICDACPNVTTGAPGVTIVGMQPTGYQIDVPGSYVIRTVDPIDGVQADAMLPPVARVHAASTMNVNAHP